MAVSVISIFLFLSTPSARRATLLGQPSRNLCIFLSTPSARRATTTAAVRMPSNMDFYPRPPRGGRLNHAIIIFPPLSHFYPRPPRGGRLSGHQTGEDGGVISIHALREEGDDMTIPTNRDSNEISIHALREEGDQSWCYVEELKDISIHALREEGDTSALS